MKNMIFGTICLVLGIIIIVSTGTSYAYFSSSINTNGDNITGEVTNFDVKLTATTIYKASRIIPLDDDYIDEAVKKETNKCIDSKGYEVCSLYRIKIINDGSPYILNGYISTLSSTRPYITDNLKCQLFDSEYNPISDVTTLSKTVGENVYLKKTNNNVAIEVNETTKKETTYYLAIWLHETNELQSDDYSKTFSGRIFFESMNGNKISADFST